MNTARVSVRLLQSFVGQQEVGFYHDALTTSKFEANYESIEAASTELSAEAQQDLEESLVYYEKLKAHKIQPKTANWVFKE